MIIAVSSAAPRWRQPESMREDRSWRDDRVAHEVAGEAAARREAENDAHTARQQDLLRPGVGPEAAGVVGSATTLPVDWQLAHAVPWKK
jgi:hypothetical protein